MGLSFRFLTFIYSSVFAWVRGRRFLSAARAANDNSQVPHAKHYVYLQTY